MNIEKMSLAVEVEGNPYFVLLTESAKKIVLQTAQGFSKDEKLQLVAMPDDYRFQAVGELNRPNNDE